MSLSHSPSVITNGLVFYYDMNNTKKSWNGGPATNMHWNGGSPFGPWVVNSGTITDVTNTDQRGPAAGAITWRFDKTGTNNQWHGWEGPFGNIFTGSAGDYWAVSYWYKTSAPAGNTGFNIGAFWLGDWSRAYNVSVVSNVSTIIADGQWHYNYTVMQINEAYTNAIIVDGPSWGYSTSTGTLYINGLSWTKTSYPVPFVAGTRSTSQAIVDLTGNSIVTANSLTYASDGTFSFNGSSNYADCGNAVALQQAASITMAAWVKPTAWGLGNIMQKNQNSGYRFRLDSTAGALWWYVSGNAAVGGVAPLNTWSYCTVTGDPSGLKVYVNDALVASNAVAFAPTAPTAGNLQIGCYAPSSESFAGTISTAAMYNRALSATEVKQNFNALRGRYGI